MTEVFRLVQAAQAFVLDPTSVQKKLQLEAAAWGSLAAPPAPAAVAVPEDWVALAQRCLAAMEAAVHFAETGKGRPPQQTCLFEIEELRAALAAAPAQAVAVLDTERLDWLEQHEDGYYNLDRVASIVGTGFLTGPLNPILQKAHATLREAIDSARGASAPAQEHATQLAGQATISAEPDAWAAVVFGGKRNGKIYSTCDTKPQCESYIGVVEQSNDSITLVARPVFLGAAPAQAQENAPAYKCPAPEGYVQPPEPEFGDGCDYEGFAGGCARMGCRPPAQDQYLCQAWGETDLPVVAIVEGLDKVSTFLVENWLGDEDATNDDGTKALPAAMQEMQADWAEEGEAWKWEIAFEIGGVSVQKVGRAAQGTAK